VVAGEEVLLAGLELPLFVFLDLHEALREEALLGRLDGVEGRRAGVDKVEEALDLLVDVLQILLLMMTMTMRTPTFQMSRITRR
jgi:hypothetical protein